MKVEFKGGSNQYLLLDGLIINGRPCLGFEGLCVIVATTSIAMILGLCYLGEKCLFDCILECIK